MCRVTRQLPHGDLKDLLLLYSGGEGIVEALGKVFDVQVDLLYAPTLTYGRWTLGSDDKQMALWIEAAQLSFLQRGTGLRLGDMVRILDIRSEVGVKHLLLRIES